MDLRRAALAALAAAVLLGGGFWVQAARERTAIAAVLQARQAAFRAGDRAAFLAGVDPNPVWRRYQEIIWAKRGEAVGRLEIRSVQRLGALRRVRAQIGSAEITYLLRRRDGRWVVSEPSAAELGRAAVRQAGFFRIHYYPRWDGPQTIAQIADLSAQIAAAVSLRVAVVPDPVDIFVHHRVEDRAAVGWEVITDRAAARRREVHLWSPNSYGWGPRAAVAEELRRALSVQLLFILPGL